MAIVANLIFLVMVFPSILYKSADGLIILLILYGIYHRIG